MYRISRGNLATLNAVISPVSSEQDMGLVRRRNEHLAGLRREVLEQVRVARGIELARYVAEKEARLIAVRAREHRQLGGLPREHDRTQLPLGRELPCVARVELEGEIIAMWTELRRLRREILSAACLVMREDLLDGRARELRHVARAC